MRKLLFSFLMAIPITVSMNYPTTCEITAENFKIKPVISQQDSEVKCLADNIFHEASSEPREGKLAVALVTLNRVKDKYYPKTFCGVVRQKVKSTCQFSWVCGNNHRFNSKQYSEAKKIAIYVYNNRNKIYDITYGALLFHSTKVNPVWAINSEPTVQIGNHLFYKRIRS